MDSHGVRPSARSSGAERRREKRYEVDLPGAVELGGVAHPVMVSDLSPSGALISAEAGDGFPAGAKLTLLVQQFGPIAARVAHVGHGFYGLQFIDPHLHRDRLVEWLRKEVDAS
ncbi:MAG: PilZ domain-containing protein [Acidisphaera sp.]|nr:PilZ domain-containing protein [Acidisphaera sp.]